MDLMPVFLQKYLYHKGVFTMPNFTTRLPIFIYCFEKSPQDMDVLDRFLVFLQRIGVGELVQTTDGSRSGPGRPKFDETNLFAGILLCCSMRRYSLREMEETMANDVRCIYVSDRSYPSYRTIGSFLNDTFAKNADRIMSTIVNGIAEETSLDLFDTHYVDGSKFEADANKYKFRWKPDRKREKLIGKINTVISSYDSGAATIDGLERLKSYLLPLRKKLVDAGYDPDNLVTGKGIRHPKDVSMYLKLSGMCAKLQQYDLDIAICGTGRNSYYLTDPDATAMCMKEDYYSGVGSNFHAAYNVQFAVSHGFIVSCMVSQDRTDFRTFRPFLDKIKGLFGKHPKKVCADAGYGSLDNYRYMKENSIANYVKYTNWAKEIDGRKSPLLDMDAEGKLRCLAGAEAVPDGNVSAHPKKQGASFYTVKCVRGCPYRDFCRRNLKKKTGMTRTIEFSVDYHGFTREAKENLLSVSGIEIRVNRSIQVEGAFGNMKENMGYERFRRTGLANVAMELVLQCIGVNIRKLLDYYKTGLLPEFWKAPEGTDPEKPHKLRKCVTGKQKKKKLSVNEKAKVAAKKEKSKRRKK